MITPRSEALRTTHVYIARPLEVGKRVATYTTDRRCQCGARISMYNKRDTCAPCMNSGVKA